MLVLFLFVLSFNYDELVGGLNSDFVRRKLLNIEDDSEFILIDIQGGAGVLFLQGGIPPGADVSTAEDGWCRIPER